MQVHEDRVTGPIGPWLPSGPQPALGLMGLQCPPTGAPGTL